MSIIIGIDVGGSTTKIVGYENGKVKAPMLIKATDPVASLFGAFGKYLYDNNIQISDIKKVMITGVGSASVTGNIYGIPTFKVDEFTADGRGAHYGCTIEKIIVVSMGTGTTIVKVDGDKISHMGGVCIGGGTLMALSNLLLKTANIDQLIGLAKRGKQENVNLQISDISKTEIPGLPANVTAALLGKIKNGNVRNEDIAIGLIWTIVQTIGLSAVLAALNSDIKDFVMIGNLASLPQNKEIFSMIGDLYNVRFHIPKYAEFRTALGAALMGNSDA